MSTLRNNTFVVFLIILMLVFTPVQTAQASGGSGAFLALALTIVAAVVMTAIGIPPIFSDFGTFLADPVAFVGAAMDAAGAALADPAIMIANLTADTALGSIATGALGGFALDCVMSNADCPTQKIFSSSKKSNSANTVHLYITDSGPSQVMQGETVTLSGPVTNNGSIRTTGAFTNEFQVFDNSVFTDQSHNLIGNSVLGTASDLIAGASTVVTASWSVPKTLPPGEYFLRLCANMGSAAINEADSSNNCGPLQPFDILAASTSYSGVATTSRALPSVHTASHTIHTDTLVAAAVGANGAALPDLTSTAAPTIHGSISSGAQVRICPPKYHLDLETKQCIPNDYVTCASIGFPNTFCQKDQPVCTLQPDHSIGCAPTNSVSCASIGRPDLYCPLKTPVCKVEKNGAVSCRKDKAAKSKCDSEVKTACSSTQNSCGMSNVGFLSCDDSCSATPPPDTQCTPPTITAGTASPYTGPGQSCTITWTVENASSCGLFSPGSNTSLLVGDTPTVPTGSYKTPPLSSQTTYTLICKNGTTVVSQAPVTCKIVPSYKER